MKKFISALFILGLCFAVYAKSQDDKFINSLRNCSSYRDSGNVNTGGVTAQSSKAILGWKDGRCAYREVINLNGANVNINCYFTKSQIQEITSVADAYYLTLQYSESNVDASSLETLKNNPLANVFSKYIQDPNVCSIGGLQ